jgi:GNAT superfamily N-acetyltransferase
MHEANLGTRLLGTPRWPLRLAVESDASALEDLIQNSVRELQAPYYSTEQINAALGPVFGVDRQLIRDGTYFVAGRGGVIVGCGGWSKRSSRFGGDRARDSEDALLDPRRDAARIRAFFVHPPFARQGIGHSIMVACESAIAEAGFGAIEIVATLAGEPLYASFNYSVVRRYDIELKGGLGLPAVEMAKKIDRTK